MAQPLPLLRVALTAALILTAAGCRSRDARLQQHHEKLESLAATAAAIAEAWLHGSVSGTYARTALERTFLLVEQERASIAASAGALADPAAAQLAERAGQFSRLVALMSSDVGARDGSALREHLGRIPRVPGGQP